MAFNRSPKPLMVAFETSVDKDYLQNAVAYPRGFRGGSVRYLLLGNISLTRALDFKNFLVGQLERNGQLKSGVLSAPRNVLADLAHPSLRDITNKALGPFSSSYLQDDLDGRVIRQVSESSHRLGLLIQPEWRTKTYMDKAVRHSLKTGAPLEIGYVKYGKTGEPEQFERVLNVRDFTSYGFRGNHDYGVRQYLWNNLLWATPLGSKPLAVGRERAIRLKFHKHGGNPCIDVTLFESTRSGSIPS